MQTSKPIKKKSYYVPVDKHRSPDGRQRLGAAGEDLACSYLKSKGMTVIGRNVRCSLGDVTTQILIQTNSRGHPLNVLVPRRLEDKCSRYSFKKVSYPIDRSRSDK